MTTESCIQPEYKLCLLCHNKCVLPNNICSLLICNAKMPTYFAKNCTYCAGALESRISVCCLKRSWSPNRRTNSFEAVNRCNPTIHQMLDSDLAISKHFQDQVQLQQVEVNFSTVVISIISNGNLYLTQEVNTSPLYS